MTSLLTAGSIVALAALSLWLTLGCWWRRHSYSAGAACVLSLLALVCGLYYDQIRWAIHDHGFTPERSFYLLAPFALGFGISAGLRRLGVFRGAWFPAGAAASLVVVFLLLFPSPNYYGSSRAITYAALVMIGVWLIHDIPRFSGQKRASVWGVVAIAFVTFTLTTFCEVGQIEQSFQVSVFVLKSSLYQVHAWVPLVLGKVVVFALLLAGGGARRALDSAGAASLLTASLLVQLAEASVGRFIYVAVLAMVVASIPFRRRWPMSQLCGGLFVLNHFYGANPAQLAPIELLLAAVSAALFAFRRARMTGNSLAIADSLTVLTAAYLLLWPSLGFRLSGIDFRFMFEWVQPEFYEELWWLIGAGTFVKVGAPYLLLLKVVEEYPVSQDAGSAVVTLLCSKVVLLSVTVAAYALSHSMHSNLATDMLSELVLVALALLWVLPLARSAPTRLESVQP